MARRMLRTDAAEVPGVLPEGMKSARRPHLLDRAGPPAPNETPTASATAVADHPEQNGHSEDDDRLRCEARPGDTAGEQSPADTVEEPHRIERLVLQVLLARTDVSFPSLTVRRMPNGLCLQGVMEVGRDVPDILQTVRAVATVDNVLNHLVVRQQGGIPEQGAFEKKDEPA